MNKILIHIISLLTLTLFSSCYSVTPRTLYPASIKEPVFKIGQKYSSKFELSHHRNLLSKWHSFSVENNERKKIPTNTIFEVVEINKTFDGTFGRSLKVWVKFSLNSKTHTAFIARNSIGKQLVNTEGYEVYLVPDPSKATLLD